jgi:hypothetical protein
VKIKTGLFATALLTIACLSGGYSSPSPKLGNAGRLWAAISVNEPVFTQGWTKSLQIYFTLVNDSDKTINPEIGASQIVVNGQALQDSDVIFNNGIRHKGFYALPPNDHLLFTYALGDKFAEPGIYRVSWRGPAFEAQEIIFRVLPQKER